MLMLVDFRAASDWRGIELEFDGRSRMSGEARGCMSFIVCVCLMRVTADFMRNEQRRVSSLNLIEFSKEFFVIFL
jgi:hypothetical protein